MITLIIIAITTAVSLAALYVVPQIIEEGILRPYYTIREHRWYQLITSGLLHASLGHLFVNMFTLYFFGLVMERTLGGPMYVFLYISALIVSGIPSLIKFKLDPDYATLGASGAVESVLFAFILIYPLESLYIMFIPIPIPAFVFGFLYLAYSMYASKQEQGKVNHEAHIAGAVYGLVFMALAQPQMLSQLYGMSYFGGN
jgi:membrane associated rhomboid family serine protease